MCRAPSALVEQYLRERSGAHAPGTVSWDRYALGVLLCGLEGTLTRERIGAFPRYLEALVSRAGRPLRPNTRARVLSSVKTFLRWLVLRGHTLEDCSAWIVVPSVERLPRPLGEDAVQVLLEACARAPVVGRRNRAIVELLYGTGLRRGEILRLRVQDLDLYERLVHVILGKGRKDRCVPLGERARLALVDYLRHERKPAPGPLFLTRTGKPLTKSALAALLARLGQAVGQTGVHPHRFRHSYATHLLRHGAPLPAVQKLLGHASLGSTQVYLEVEVEDLRRMLERSHPHERSRR